MNIAADLQQLTHDDVHADTTSRYLTQLVRRREAFVEYQTYRFLISERIDVDLCIQTFLKGGLTNRVRIDASTIIGQSNNIIAARLAHINGDSTAGRLACGDPLIRRLNAMIERVPYHMLQNDLQTCVVIAIQRACLVQHLKRDHLAKIRAHGANNAPQPRHQARYRHDPRALYCRRNTRNHHRLLLQERLYLSILSCQHIDEIRKILDALAQNVGGLLQLGVLVHFQCIHVWR